MVDEKSTRRSHMIEKQFGLNISKLTLKNFATFDDQTVNFVNQFNAIVGETGSGKSLILDALQLILGHRADKKLVRKSCDYAIVEACFSCNDLGIKQYFNDIGFPYDETEIVIKRILYKTGKTKSYINHQSCSLSTLVEFSKNYIDLVGQFENQKLLSDDYQLALVDNYAVNNTLKDEYSITFQELLKTIKELDQLLFKKAEFAQKLDYISFQISEIEKLNPSLEDEQELLAKKRLLQNLDENRSSVARLNSLFDGNQASSGLLSLINQIENLLTDKLLDEETLSQFQNAKETLNDINYKINSSLDIDFNETEFESVLTSLDSYQKLKRKFSVDTEGLITILTNFQTERDEIDNIHESINLYEERITKLKIQAYQLAEKLHERRIKFAKELSKKLTEEVRQLRMIGATIKIELTKSNDINKNGVSLINFLAETNPGEGFYKIKDIASGGELSRILLALRTVLSTKDSISVFLFDEIDSGIGGETALAVGNALAKVALSSQVIAITHLPQIANFSAKIIKVSKEIISFNDSERTVSIVKEVSGKELKQEVSLMSSLN
jgi:DNA repair protein RecN (Recombination protein N)